MFALDFNLKSMSKDFGLYENISENLVTSLNFNKKDRRLEPFVINIDIMGSEFNKETFKEKSDKVKIGELQFYAFNLKDANCDVSAESFLSFDYEDILGYYMGEYNEDTFHYLEAFKKMYSNVFKGPDCIFEREGEPYILCLQRFFIDPEYRGNGIGKYIAENITNIVFEVCNINTLYIVGYIKPDDGTEEMKNLQKKLFEKIGCTLLQDHKNNYYFAKSA